jgi:hypothetical protein
MGYKVELEKDEIETIIADQNGMLLSFHYGGIARGMTCATGMADCPLDHFDLAPEETNARQSILKKMIRCVR